MRSPEYDPLYAHSLVNDGPGRVLDLQHRLSPRVSSTDIGGFSDDYPYPHCEDLDMAYRALRRGSIGFAPAMAILHHPKPLSARQWMLRGRMTVSEIVLFDRFRERFGRAARLPARLFPSSHPRPACGARWPGRRGAVRCGGACGPPRSPWATQRSSRGRRCGLALVAQPAAASRAA